MPAGDVPSRLQVLQALTRKFKLAPDVDLGAVAALCAPRRAFARQHGWQCRLLLPTCLITTPHLPPILPSGLLVKPSCPSLPAPASCRFTGADLYALCSDAWMCALKRAIAAAEAAPAQEEEEQQQQQQQDKEQQAVDGGSSSAASGAAGATGPAGSHEAAAQQHDQQGDTQQQTQQEGSSSDAGDEEVEVRQADFMAAVATVQPSLSVEEVAKYEAIRDEYESQATKARRY